jgi:K+/H+ antiporter YhaU regulatory subunit KhtT
MSPYQQNVTDFQKSRAIDDYSRQLPGMGAAASKAGAFGGSRQAIVESEGQRNLQDTLAGIQATGSQNAFQQAQQAQQFGANLGMTGYNQALQGASTLANIGGQELGAQQSIANAQNTMGAQQQALEQNKINQGIQNYATQQQYPMMQLGMMSNMLRGLPMQSTTTQSYQAAPSTASQLVGSAGALASVYQGMNAVPKKEGGVIRGLAHGGSVNGQGYAVGGEIKQQLSTMTEEQLQQVVRTSASNEIRAMAAEILAGKEMAKRMTSQMPSSPGAGQGIAAADTGDMFTNMADGGIIAFAPGGYTDDELAANRAKLQEEENVPKLTPEQMDARMASLVAPGLPPEKRPNMQPGAGASIEDYAKYLSGIRTDAGIGAPRQAEKEGVTKNIAGRPAEERSQNYFKLAEGFAKWANTPGPLLRGATAAAAEVLPEFAKLQIAQRQVRANDAKILADITEAERLERVGLFDQAAKLRSEAEKLKGENDRNAATIAGQFAAIQEQGRNQLAAENVRGGFNIQGHEIDAASRLAAAGIQAGARGVADRREAEVFAAYIADIKLNNSTWSDDKVMVAAYQQMQKDYRGGEAKQNAAGEEAEAKRYATLKAGKEGAFLRTAIREQKDIERIPVEKRTKEQVTELLRLKQNEVDAIARLREAAKRVPRAAAGSTDAPAAPAGGSTLTPNANGTLTYTPPRAGG